jgi:hypothetical protein
MSCRTLLSSGLLFAVVCFAPMTGRAQVLIRINPDGPPLSIDQATAHDVIDQALKHLEEEYVYPDVAAKMAQAIRKRLADGAYADVKTGQALAERLTADLRGVSHDKHLRVDCITEKLPKPSGQQAPTPERQARIREIGAWMNGGYRKVERLPGNIGYLAVDAFPSVEAAAGPAAAAMNFLADTNALIIDLRRNDGGSPDAVALLCSYFFESKPIHLNSLYWRKGNRTEDSWTLKEVAGKRYLGKDVYILTSQRTFSGGEECAYDMQTQKRATLVGETTGGGAHAGGGVLLGDHFIMFVPSVRAINPITKTDWEGTGVKPDVPAAADEALEKAHKLAVQKLLSNARDEETREQIRMDLEQPREKPPEKAATQTR